MMIDKRLIGTVPQSKKTIAANVLFQWGALCANIVLMAALARLLQRLYLGAADAAAWARLGGAAALALAVRYACTVLASRMSYLSAKAVKKTLRSQIYRKLLRLGAGYT